MTLLVAEGARDRANRMVGTAGGVLLVSGVVVARRGLGANPLRLILVANLATWAACVVFPLRSSIVLVTMGMVVWLALIPVVEAAEQTVLQQSIPFGAPPSWSTCPSSPSSPWPSP